MDIRQGDWDKQKIKIKIDEPMASHTSLKVGGMVDLLLWPANDGQLRYSLKFAKKKNLPIRVIGRGTNLLVKDEGIRGVVIVLIGDYKLKMLLDKGEKKQRGIKEVVTGAGTTLANLGAFALKNNLTGMECLSAIPGTLGGALMMNAGAGGQEIGSLVESVRIMNYEGNIHDISKEDIHFGYRSSSLKEKGVILGAKLKLASGKHQEILKKTKEHIHWRNANQPIGDPSAGSIFKNSPEGPAGKLMEAAGLKGLRVGGAEISTKHANFIINSGGAKASDILELIDIAKNRILEKSGAKMELEIEVV